MGGRVVHVNDNAEGAIYIGRWNYARGLRKSIWSNPFKVTAIGRGRAIAQYRERLTGPMRASLLPFLPELRGKPLACWCRHDGDVKAEHNACHGDVLLELLDRYTDDELRSFTE